MVAKIKPKVAIPCHYDMFADNAVDLRQFRASLKLFAPDTAISNSNTASRSCFRCNLPELNPVT